jgi:hypothetical protein
MRHPVGCPAPETESSVSCHSVRSSNSPFHEIAFLREHKLNKALPSASAFRQNYPTGSNTKYQFFWASPNLLAFAFLLSTFRLQANPIVIDFESFTDSTVLTSQISGLMFSNATVITAGITLNELEFPPHSGRNVVFDDGGPISISFQSTETIVGGYFTYTVPLTLQGFDARGNALPAVNSRFSNNDALFGQPGSQPNEFLEVQSSGGISRLVITGDISGTSFTMDDLTVQPVPEAPSLVPLLTVLLALIWHGLRRSLISRCPSGGLKNTSTVLSILMVLGTVWCARAQQIQIQATVALPAVDPAVATQGTPVLTTVSAYITYPDSHPVLPGSVNLLQISAEGVATILATLNDDGTNGDAVAGDSIFSGQIQPTTGSTGLIRLQVSAAFEGMLLRVRSPIAIFEVFPAGVPTQHMPPDLSSLSNVCTDVSGNNEVCNEILMLFKPGTDYFAEVGPTAASVGGTVVGVANFPTVNIWEVTVPCTSDSCIQSVVAALQQKASQPNLVGAEPDFLTNAEQMPVMPNDPQFALQWGLPQVQAPLAWSFTTGAILPAQTMVPFIAIVDSGVDVTHPDFAGKTPRIGTNWINRTGTATTDETGHGTKVAGVAGATGNNATAIAGASWSALLIPIKVFGPLGGDTSSTVKGFREAVDLGATVVNFSGSGTARTETEAAALDYINSASRVLVAAAGNQSMNVRRYPAGFALSECFGVLFVNCYTTRKISVGATDMADARAGFSNFGSWVFVYAPGVCILTTVRAGDPTVAAGDPCLAGMAAPPAAARLNYVQGTSFATPLVSGVSSLVIAALPTAGGAGPLSTITQLSDNTGNVNTDGSLVDRLNAFRAVRCAATGVCQ